MTTIDQRREDIAHCAECGSENVVAITGAEYTGLQRLWRTLLHLHRPGTVCMAWCSVCFMFDAKRWPHTMVWHLPRQAEPRTWQAMDAWTHTHDPERVS